MPRKKIEHDDFHDLFNLIEERRLETDEKIMVLHKRITESNEKIIEEIADLKKNVKQHTSSEENALQSINKRLTALESMKWIVIGGGFSIGFLILEIDNIRKFLS